MNTEPNNPQSNENANVTQQIAEKAKLVAEKGTTYAKENAMLVSMIGLFVGAAMAIIICGCKKKPNPMRNASNTVEELLHRLLKKIS